MPANCWCMWWRARSGDAGKNKKAMSTIVRRGDEPGLIAYDDDTPVGWASVAPRDTDGQLMKSRSYKPQDEEPDVWSIVCFYVDPRAKKRGVREALVEGAVKHALKRGARAIEAYPHVRGDYMGSPEAFERHGFARVRDAGSRVVMRLERKRGDA